MAGVATAALVLTGCAAARPPTGGPSATAAAGRTTPSASAAPGERPMSALPPGATRRWVLVTLQDADGAVQNPTPVPTLDLLDPALVRGSDGCNSFTGRLLTTGAEGAAASASAGPSVAISVADLRSSERACTATNGIEDRYLRILQRADRLTVAGSRLSLRAGESTLVFALDRMVTVQPVQPTGP